MRENKLYVWEDVLCDWTCGVIFALAPTLEDARRIVLANSPEELLGAVRKEMDREPDVYTTPYGHVTIGGA